MIDRYEKFLVFAFVQSLPIYHVEGFSIYQEMKTTLNWRRLSFPFIFEVNITLLLFESSRYDCVITVFLPLEYIYIYYKLQWFELSGVENIKDQKLGKTLFIASSIYTEYI